MEQTLNDDDTLNNGQGDERKRVASLDVHQPDAYRISYHSLSYHTVACVRGLGV